MPNLKLRPRFAVDAACDATALVRELEERAPRADPPLAGHFDDAHCVLRIPPPRCAFFTPELDVTFEDRPEAAPGHGVRVRCLFSPRPAIWTGFAFAYAMLALTGLSGLILGIAQLSLGLAAWGLLVTLGCLACLGVVYASSYVGQRLAASQMDEIRRCLDACLERAEARARSEPCAEPKNARR